MTEQAISVICFCFVTVCAIQGATVYFVIKMLTLSRSAIFERKPDTEHGRGFLRG